MPPPASNDTDTRLGQDGSNWSRDLAILIFDLGGRGACGWCGSSSSIRLPSLKFVGLAVREIWCTMCVSINGPGDLDFWPCELETSTRVALKVKNSPSKFEHARYLGSRIIVRLINCYIIIRYVRDGRTDGQTEDRQKQRFCLSSTAVCSHTAGGIILKLGTSNLICMYSVYRLVSKS